LRSSILSGQFADADVPELNRRAFRFHAQKARARFGAASARNLLAVDPQPHFAVDAPDIIVVPFIDPFAEIFSREAARAVGRQRWERLQFRFAHGEDVTVGGEPVTFLPGTLLVLLGKAMVQYLDFNAVLR